MTTNGVWASGDRCTYGIHVSVPPFTRSLLLAKYEKGHAKVCPGLRGVSEEKSAATRKSADGRHANSS